MWIHRLTMPLAWAVMFAVVGCASQPSAGTSQGGSRSWVTLRGSGQAKLGSLLNGVSCASARVCVAAGSGPDTGRPGSNAPGLGEPEPLAESGGSVAPWRVVPVLPHLIDSEFDDVSCVSRGICVAVGDQGTGTLSGGGSRTLAESWNGTRWTRMPSPDPVAGLYSDNELQTVSCSSASSCVAAGFGQPARSPDQLPMAESWNGHRWTVTPSPDPGRGGAGGTGITAGDISCASVTACLLVSTTETGAALDSWWNGHTWTITPRPGGVLYGVSCLSARDCIAVGGRWEHQPLAERWDGRRWAVLPTPSSAGSLSGLRAVSCAAPDRCVAVGSTYYGIVKGTSGSALVESWNGRIWTVVPSARTARSAELTSVSCPTAATCVAVGDDGINPDGGGPLPHTLIEGGP